MKTTSIILAGGKNRRLGKNKALISISGQSMIERVIERLIPITDRFLVVTSPELVELPVASEVEVLTDLYPGLGPLGGIYTGLLSSQSQENIVVACDMPFLNAQLIEYMLDLSSDVDAVVPQLDNGMIEPLHAIYSQTCLERMRGLLEDNRLGVTPFLRTLCVRYVEPSESRKLDPELLSLFNINFQSDLDRAIALDAEGNH